MSRFTLLGVAFFLSVAAEAGNNETIVIKALKDIQAIDSSPQNYVGKTVEVPRSMAWLNGRDLVPNRDSNGYVFMWKYGRTATDSQPFGERTLRERGLNYWLNINQGGSLKKILKDDQTVQLNFVISEEVIQTKTIYVATWKK